MSFLTGIRAGTSRSGMPSSCRVSSRSVPLPRSTPTFLSKRTVMSTTQDVDRELAAIKRKHDAMVAANEKAMARMEIMGRGVKGVKGVDLDRIDMFHFVPVTEPYYEFKWLWRNLRYRKDMTLWEAVQARFQWTLGSFRGSAAMAKALGMIADGKSDYVVRTSRKEKDGMSRLQRFKTFLGYTKSLHDQFRPTVREALDVYIRYHAAQAKGNTREIEATSIRKMRELGLKVAKAQRGGSHKATWELLEEPPLPKIKWFEETDMGEGSKLRQICLQIETKQRLELQSSSRKKTVKEQNINDYVIFAFKDPAAEGEGMVMYDRPIYGLPMFMLDEAKQKEREKVIADWHKHQNALMSAGVGTGQGQR